MKEQLLAINSQNIYSENRGDKPMSDGNTVSPESTEGVPLKQEPLREKPRESLAETKEEEKKARDGLKDFLDEKVQKKAREGAPAKLEQNPEQRPAGEYFSQVPSDSHLTTYVNNLCVEAEGKTLTELETRLLSKYYLLLRQKAEETGSDPAFLTSLKNELSERGIHVDRLFTTAKQIYEQVKRGVAGGEVNQQQESLDLTGVADEGLQRIGAEINLWLETVGSDPSYLRSAWERVGSLTNVDVDQQRELLRRIGDLLRTTMAEQVRQQLLEREEYPGRGLYGEHRLTGQERRNIEHDVTRLVKKLVEIKKDHPEKDLGGEQIEGEFLDYYFNDIFRRRTDSRQKDEFKDALGPGGQYEYMEFIDTLASLPESARLGETPREFEERRVIQRRVIQKLIDKYTTEYKVRELMHNAYWVAETQRKVDEFTGYCSQFASSYADLAFFDAPEVEAAAHILEFVLYRIKSENNGFIPSDKVEYVRETGKSEFIDRAYNLLQDWNQKGLFGGKPLPEWKLARALTLARGFEMVTLRLPEIIAECKLPAIPDSNESQVSIPWETISWELNPWDHKYKRYRIWKELRAVFYTDSGEKTEWWQKWNQQKIKDMLAYDMITGLADDNDEVERIIDTRNIFKIGGPFTHSGWRSFVAALNDEDGTGFKKYLSEHGGLQLRQLWNRYLYKDEVAYRDQFIEGYTRDHPGVISKLTMEREWEKRKKELEDQGKVEWKKADWEEWVKASQRIPYVVLRIITDEDNRLLSKSEREALLEAAFGLNPSNTGPKKFKEFNDRRDEVEQDLALAKEHLLFRRGEGGLKDEDWAVIVDKEGKPDEKRQKAAKRLQAVVEARITNDIDLKKKILNAIDKRKFPFALTTEDVPFKDFSFAKTGTRGFITRRINDFQQEVLAGQGVYKLLSNLPMYESPEQIVAQIVEIFKEAQVHDFDRAREAMQIIARGIIRLYQKDTELKVPISGSFKAIFNRFQGKGQSYAQTVYGLKAMAWNATDIYNFTEQLRGTPIFMGEQGLDMIKKLRAQTGGRLWQALGERTQMALWLLILIFGYEMAEKIMKEKAA